MEKASKTESDTIYVETEESLKVLLSDLGKASRVAVDTEADSLHHYFEKVCLIQLSFEGKHFIVDPLSGISMSEFLENLARKELILHGADFDLRMLKTSFDFKPRKPIFDTMFASQVLGYEKIGLAALVEKFFGIKLSKSGQKSDWAKRPLTETQLKYATDDTRYLEEIADKMTIEMRKLNRMNWHKECCERVVEVTTQISKMKQQGEDEWRIKGSGTLHRKVLVFIKELWLWRDEEARKVDRPPFMVMTNEALIDLAKWLANNSKGLLVSGPKLPKNCKGTRLELLEKAIGKARSIPEAKWPEQKKSKRPTELPCKKKIDELRAACKKVANDLKIEPSFLASRAALTAVVVHQPKSEEQIMTVGRLMNWQVKLVKPMIEEVLYAD